MSLQEQLAAAQQAASEATAQVAAIQAQIDALAPHETVLQRIEALIPTLSIEAQDALSAMTRDLRGLLGL